MQNARLRPEGVYTYSEGAQTRIEKRIQIKKKKPVRSKGFPDVSLRALGIPEQGFPDVSLRALGVPAYANGFQPYLHFTMRDFQAKWKALTDYIT